MQPAAQSVRPSTSTRRLPLQQAPHGSTSGGPVNGRRPATVPNSPKLQGGAGAEPARLTTGTRRGSSTSRMAEGSDSVLQKALSSDEFIKRKRVGGVSENSNTKPATKPTSRPMSRNHSSSSATSSNGSTSTVQPSRPLYSQPRASRSQTSLASRQRSRSRTRSSRPSPVLAAAILPSLPSNHRTVSSSSCPEPRGATLSATPTTSEPVMMEVQAEGELELRGKAGGNAAEVLVELRDGRSVPNSEYGDDDRDAEDLRDSEPILVHHNTPSVPIVDLPSHPSRPSEITSPPSKSQRRPSISRARSSPSAILTTSPQQQDAHRSSSIMSTSPRQLSSTVASARPSPSSSPDRIARSVSQHRGRPIASPSSSTAAVPYARTPSQSRSTVDEKRLKRCSAEATPASPQRPPLVTYTSFGDTFGLEAPRSPTGSPTKVESKGGWWSR